MIRMMGFKIIRSRADRSEHVDPETAVTSGALSEAQERREALKGPQRHKTSRKGRILAFGAAGVIAVGGYLWFSGMFDAHETVTTTISQTNLMLTALGPNNIDGFEIATGSVGAQMGMNVKYCIGIICTPTATKIGSGTEEGTLSVSVQGGSISYQAIEGPDNKPILSVTVDVSGLTIDRLNDTFVWGPPSENLWAKLTSVFQSSQDAQMAQILNGTETLAQQDMQWGCRYTLGNASTVAYNMVPFIRTDVKRSIGLINSLSNGFGFSSAQISAVSGMIKQLDDGTIQFRFVGQSENEKEAGKIVTYTSTDLISVPSNVTKTGDSTLGPDNCSASESILANSSTMGAHVKEVSPGVYLVTP